MTNYIIVDTANTFFRARYTVRGDTDIIIGSMINVTLSSVRKAWKDFSGEHVVFALEGRSWRKDYYPPYKRNRAESRAAIVHEKDLEEEKLFWEAFDEFKKFIIEKTNCTVLHHPCLEADDLIAGWIESHPSDSHTIISTDSDFVQLITPNVKQYHGINEHIITDKGTFTLKGKPVIDNKTKQPKGPPDTGWILFEKCIRGDSTDNVFSAYPKVRKTKLLEAYADHGRKGFAWNNLMLQRWVDHNGEEHRVLDDYERNRQLIDLKAQPPEVKEFITDTIRQNSNPKDVRNVGVRLLKFCGLFDLVKISEQADSYAEILNSKYPE